MKQSWMKTMLIPLVALAIGVVGCEVNQAALGPSVEKELSRGTDRAEGLRVKGKPPQDVGNSPTVTAVIGPEGGTLEHAGHRLTVPAGAVAERSLFRMKVADSGYVELDLTATGTGNGRNAGVEVKGFATPVELRISYSYAEGVTDPNQLRVAWVQEDGTVLELPSVIDEGAQTVTADLDHFSKYALVFD